MICSWRREGGTKSQLLSCAVLFLSASTIITTEAVIAVWQTASMLDVARQVGGCMGSIVFVFAVVYNL